MGLCAAELRASGPRAQCWAHLQAGQHLPWHIMALLGPLGPPKGLGLLRRALQRRCAAERWACPGLSVNFYPFARGSGCRGEGGGLRRLGPSHGKAGWSWDAARPPPHFAGSAGLPVSPAPWGLVLWGPGAVIEGAQVRSGPWGCSASHLAPPGVVSWGCALLHTPCAAGAGGCALRPWQFGGTLQQ